MRIFAPSTIRMTPPSTCALLPSSAPKRRPTAWPTRQQAERDAGDERRSRPDVHGQRREADAHGQRVDAGGHGLHQHKAQRKALLRRARPGLAGAQLAQRLGQHFAADEAQQYEGDPVVHRADGLGEQAAGEKAENGHQPLKNAEGRAGEGAVAPAQAGKAQAVRHGHGERVHRKAQRQQKQRGKRHGFPSFPVCRRAERGAPASAPRQKKTAGRRGAQSALSCPRVLFFERQSQARSASMLTLPRSKRRANYSPTGNIWLATLLYNGGRALSTSAFLRRGHIAQRVRKAPARAGRSVHTSRCRWLPEALPVWPT